MVIGIIGILTALSLAGVQYGREMSRRLACASNLKQLGLALNSYQASFNVYPQGTNGGLRRFSGQVSILPFLEQTVLYNALNMSVLGPIGGFETGGPNETVGRTIVGGFLCPSDPDGPGAPVTNYAWNGGYGDQTIDFVGGFCSRWTRNFFYISPSDIRDGLSNTAAMSEWRIGHVDAVDDSAVVFRIKVGAGEPYDAFVRRCQQATRESTEFGAWKKNASWAMGGYNYTLLNFNSPPNSLSCYYDMGIDLGDWPASSFHSGGVNVLFYDAHVTFHRNTVSASTWRSISTRSSGDTGD